MSSAEFNFRSQRALPQEEGSKAEVEWGMRKNLLSIDNEMSMMLNKT